MSIEPTLMADIQVPKEVSRLRDLSYNMWWSWTPRARAFFSSIDRQLFYINYFIVYTFGNVYIYFFFTTG